MPKKNAEQKRYAVTLPVCGSVTVFVEADSEESALELAHGHQDWRVVHGKDTEVNEFDSMNHIVKGNVCYAPCTEASVELHDELLAAVVLHIESRP